MQKKPNKISNSKLNMYSDCGRKYDFYYNKKLRSKHVSGALIFGRAVDLGLNKLLETKDIEKAKLTFIDALDFAEINGQKTALSRTTLLRYSNSDFDKELILEQDFRHYKSTFNSNLLEDFDRIEKLKEEVGYENLEPDDISRYNLANWLCIRRKGLIMIDSYQEKVLPRIKKVIAIQESIKLDNQEGDELVGFLDVIAELDDGKTYLLDHKTSTIDYQSDSAGKSPQLLLYYHAVKEEKNLSGVGFIVLKKNINKNKTKICKTCKYDGSGATHKTCPAEKEVVGKKPQRCHGEWNIELDPECHIDIILNTVKPASEDLIIETYDAANEAIKAGKFNPNLSSCMKYGKPCDFMKVCWEGNYEDVVDMSKKNE